MIYFFHRYPRIATEMQKILSLQHTGGYSSLWLFQSIWENRKTTKQMSHHLAFHYQNRIPALFIVFLAIKNIAVKGIKAILSSVLWSQGDRVCQQICFKNK